MGIRGIATVAVLAAGVVGIAALSYSQSAQTQEVPGMKEVRVVEVRNDCPHTVWIWYGRGELLQPVDALTLAGRSSSFESMIEGDMVWLLDDEREQIEGAAVTPTTQRLVIDDSCRGIAPSDQDQ